MKKEKIFWGLFFIFGAAFIIFGRLGYLREVSVFSLMLTIFFAAMLIKSLMHLEYTGILFSIAFLCIIYAGPLGITAVTPWPVLGAALLGSIGCHLLFPSRKRDGRNGTEMSRLSQSLTRRTELLSATELHSVLPSNM